MLNSYIFVFRKQNATRNCNVLFEFSYFGFLDPPNADHLKGEACYDAAHIKLVGEVEELGESCKLLAEKVHFAFKLGIPGIRCH